MNITLYTCVSVSHALINALFDKMANPSNMTLPWYGFPYSRHDSVGGSQSLFKILVLSTLMLLTLLYLLREEKDYDDGLPVVNRLFSREPHFFSRLRWAVWARNILDNAHEKVSATEICPPSLLNANIIRQFGDKPYRLARGDADVIVLPAQYIPELNQLPEDVISSRQWHALTMLGNISGIDIVRKTSYHVKILLSRISPVLPELLVPTAQRLCRSIERVFPQQIDGVWVTVDPLDTIVRCVSEGLALILYGEPVCDNPDIIQLCHEHTKHRT